MSSDIFGLIVGNVGLTHSQPLLAKLRMLLKKHRKKSYTLSVGRLNPAKLANFETIECFVLVGCAEGGMVDSKVSRTPASMQRGVDRASAGLLPTYHHTLGTIAGASRTRRGMEA